MTDEFLLVVISGLSAVMIVLIVQIAIQRFQSANSFWGVIRNLMLLIRLAILVGLIAGSFYYSLQMGYDDFHVTVATVFLVSGIAAFIMAVMDRYLERKQKADEK